MTCKADQSSVNINGEWRVVLCIFGRFHNALFEGLHKKHWSNGWQ